MAIETSIVRLQNSNRYWQVGDRKGIDNFGKNLARGQPAPKAGDDLSEVVRLQGSEEAPHGHTRMETFYRRLSKTAHHWEQHKP